MKNSFDFRFFVKTAIGTSSEIQFPAAAKDLRNGVTNGQHVFVAAAECDLLPQRARNLGRFVLLSIVLSVVVFTCRGMPGVTKLLKPITNQQIPPGWYLLVLLWAPSIALIVLVGKGMHGIFGPRALFTKHLRQKNFI